MQKKLLSWLFVGFIVVVASCKKDDDIISVPTVQAEKTNDTLYVKDSLLLHPQVSTKNGVTYKWTVNGATVGTDSVYKFKPAESGDFQVIFEASNSVGKNSLTFNLHVWRKYENGFFILSEGQFMTASGDVNFYDYGLDTLYTKAYSAENPGSTIGSNTSTLQFGTIIDSKLYLVGKYGGPMVVTDAKTLKETGRIASLPGNNGRALIPVNTTTGWLSTVDGIYPVTLSNLALGTKIAAVNGDARDMVKAGNYVFVLSPSEGIVILDANQAVVKTISGTVTGFTSGKDGSIWAASVSALIKINPATLAVDSVKTGFDVRYNEWDYTPGSIIASTAEDAIFVASGSNVYRYVPGNTGSLGTPFITLPAGQYFYGQGIAYDKNKNQLVVTATGNLYGDNNNSLHLYNAANGTLTHTLSYTGYYYPGMVVFP